MLDKLREDKLYWREHYSKDGQLWDKISDAPMSTEFAISRFLTPILAKSGWALFMDCDVLVRTNLARLFEMLENAYRDCAIACVHHNHAPTESVKMDGQVQTKYGKKNWSSVCAYNCDHPANKELTVELINSVSGRALHQFCWLADKHIGALPKEYNWLVGEYPYNKDAKIVHFTLGVPNMAGYENCDYSSEWRSALNEWAT